RLPTSKQSVATIVEPNNLFDPLDAHVEMPSRSARDSVSYQPRVGERPAVLPQNGRHFRVGDTGRSAVAINNSAAEPRAFVGDRDEPVAARFYVDPRDATKRRIFRLERQPSAEFQTAKAHF